MLGSCLPESCTHQTDPIATGSRKSKLGQKTSFRATESSGRKPVQGNRKQHQSMYHSCTVYCTLHNNNKSAVVLFLVEISSSLDQPQIMLKLYRRRKEWRHLNL